MSTDKTATSKSTQLSTTVWVKVLENALKLNFEALWLTENLNLLQGPTHSDPIINKCTEQVIIVVCYRWKSSSHWKARIQLPVACKQNCRHTHQNPSPVSDRSAYPLQNYVCFSPLTSGLETYSLWQARDWGLLSLIRKRTGPRMLNGQLSRPRNSWMPFTFQPALWVLQQPQTFILTAASYWHWASTSRASSFINSLRFHFFIFYFIFLSPRGFLQSTARPHQSTAKPLERAASV